MNVRVTSLRHAMFKSIAATFRVGGHALWEVRGLERPPGDYAVRPLARADHPEYRRWADYLAATPGLTPDTLFHFLFEEQALREKLGPLARKAVVYRDSPTAPWMHIRGHRLDEAARAKLLEGHPLTQFAVDLLDTPLLPPQGQRPGGLYLCSHWPS